MKIWLNLILALTLACSLGCARKVVKSWASAGGSRADATVEVGYTYNPNLEIPETNEAQGRKVAEEKCRFWGYSEAEPFGMVKRTCQQWAYDPIVGRQCVDMLVSQQYQCLGIGDDTRQLDVMPKKPIKR
ncbi:MAG: hypothetical protein HDQ92_07430 [Desulfovibrio sp.]|nr:hypothetical protein [Desulfovibrio sp.]